MELAADIADKEVVDNALAAASNPNKDLVAGVDPINMSCGSDNKDLSKFNTFGPKDADDKGMLVMDWVETYEEHQRSMYLRNTAPRCLGPPIFRQFAKNIGGGSKNMIRFNHQAASEEYFLRTSRPPKPTTPPRSASTSRS